MTKCLISRSVNKDEFKRLRDRLNMTQEELAKELGVTTRTIIRWESGDREIPRTVELAMKQIAPDYRR